MASEVKTGDQRGFSLSQLPLTERHVGFLSILPVILLDLVLPILPVGDAVYTSCSALYPADPPGMMVMSRYSRITGRIDRKPTCRSVSGSCASEKPRWSPALSSLAI